MIDKVPHRVHLSTVEYSKSFSLWTNSTDTGKQAEEGTVFNTVT